MGSIREFRNVDLPQLARVWIEHWGACGDPPAVSAAMIEQAVLSRTFLSNTVLLVAKSGDDPAEPQMVGDQSAIDAWCHLIGDPHDPATAILAAICFTRDGLEVCDLLLEEIEKRATASGFRRIVAGPLRDQSCGYTGLPPIGHGIGVSASDNRTGSLLTRHGYTPAQKISRLSVTTNPYRMPVSRVLMQLRRTTRTERENWFPSDPRHASAMAHIDIEHHQLINHLTGEHLASVQLWLSDPEAQIFSGANAMLDLSTESPDDLNEPEQFLIGSIILTAASRRIFQIETAVDTQDIIRIKKLSELHFQTIEQGSRWIKELPA